MRLPHALMLTVMLAVSMPPIAAGQEGEPDSNPYAGTYVSRQPAPPGQAAAAQIYLGKDKLADYQRMLEDGYDLLGYSSFEAGDVAPELLTQHARQVRADVALVYTEGVQRPQAKGARYKYFASYWTRLPPPLFGVHVQRDTQADEGVGGLEVLAVIKDSPAARAGLRQGDILLRMGEVQLMRPEQLAETARRYAGQAVDVDWKRDGAPMRHTLTLGRP